MWFKKHFRRREAPWEVIDSKAVNPIPIWDEDEGEQNPWTLVDPDTDGLATALDVVRMHSVDMHFKFVHELRRVSDMRKAVQHARHQLMQEAARQNYNVMIVEGCVRVRPELPPPC